MVKYINMVVNKDKTSICQLKIIPNAIIHEEKLNWHDDNYLCPMVLLYSHYIKTNQYDF